MKYKIVVYELREAIEASAEVHEAEVYRQIVENLSLPALVDLVNNGRRRVRTRAEKVKGAE